jgi:hypothetical protein
LTSNRGKYRGVYEEPVLLPPGPHKYSGYYLIINSGTREQQGVYNSYGAIEILPMIAK